MSIRSMNSDRQLYDKFKKRASELGKSVFSWAYEDYSIEHIDTDYIEDALDAEATSEYFADKGIDLADVLFKLKGKYVVLYNPNGLYLESGWSELYEAEIYSSLEEAEDACVNHYFN